jgi:starch synthase
LPGFPAIIRGVADAQPLTEASALPHGARLLRGALADGAVAYVIEAPSLYDREGNPYTGPDGKPYPDNHRRFALLGFVGARLAEGIGDAWAPQIVHGHDWHAGLAPAYLRASSERAERRVAASVHTVHNLAFQGNFKRDVFGELQLPAHFYATHGVEFHHQVSFMKAGLHYADKITTVSPTYAHEIQGKEQGAGFDGVLRARAADLVGVLNGVDDTVWNPKHDPLIAQRYETSDMSGKQACRGALRREFALATRNDAPVFGVVSRLTEQKGVNLILARLPELVARGGQLVVLGSGDAQLEHGLREAAAHNPDSVGVRIGYDEALAHRIVAGSDVLMVPSRFEPCGLTQLYALKYGTLPLVRRVGGLADTVVDCALENLAEDMATGFVFDRFDDQDYLTAVRRAFALWKRGPEWTQVQRRAMTQDFSWDAAAARYVSVYERAWARMVRA